MESLKDILGQGFGEKVLDYMKELAKGLGVSAEHVYEVLVRQQIAFGIAPLVGSFLGIIILSIGMYKIGKWLIKNDGKEAFIAYILPVAGLVGCFFGFFNGFMHIYNPEYYAIQEIIHAISGKS